MRLDRGLAYLAGLTDDTPEEVLTDWEEVLHEMAEAGLNVAAVKYEVEHLAERRKQLCAEAECAKLASTPTQEGEGDERT